MVAFNNVTRSAWIWGARTDASAFFGPALLALLLALLAPTLHLRGALPPWGFLIFIVAVDVAHVHTTLFRTYFDREERRKRRTLYALLPLGLYALFVFLHARSALTFWRVLAYVAVFHFVRQQVGWVAIYRARAGEKGIPFRLIDDGLCYLATLYPLAVWHSHLPRSFHWFTESDFVSAPWLAAVTPGLGVVYILFIVVYTVHEVWWYRARRFTSWGKHLVITSTMALWYVGIVATDDDFTFTVTNVLGHGIPYAVLLWKYTQARAKTASTTFLAKVASWGVLSFIAIVLAIAFFEEALWDRLVWHQKTWLFGGTFSETPLLSPLATTLVVPLLALPQATHYVLDAVLWRRRDTGPAQAEALGFFVRPSESGAQPTPDPKP